MVGNGKHISFSHIGHVYIPSSVKPILLKNVLHTPKISKQLISVTKLCADNKAFIEFFSTYFLVNDQGSKKVLLQGNLENGLHKFNPVSISSTSSSIPLTPSLATCSSSPSSSPVQAFLNPIMLCYGIID